MSKMIYSLGNFQYSVNIAYDLHNSDKLKSFIPTKSSLELLEEILLSTQSTSSKRARILIGAYGKGKSHIVLSILSILMGHRPKSDFVHLNKKLEKMPRLNLIVENYYASGKKLLPVLVSGTSTNLSSSFLVALKNSLSQNNLLELMPKTNYLAAVNAIKKWETDFPKTLKSFEAMVGCSASEIIFKLEDFDSQTYLQFELAYPALTSGSCFNPFLGFDVVEIYLSVVKELRRQKLYDGIYVVYDEFSKYLETNIETATVSDTKMLQDFAEMSCRSNEDQLHLLLISHKEIGNYIDRLPKQKSDGWKGISERFTHILLNNNFSQVYQIICSVIQKEKYLYKEFLKTHANEFASLVSDYKNHQLFSELKDGGEIKNLVEESFPLHPVSIFILPRLSERIAQNERTLFTFLSADGEFTLSAFLKTYQDQAFTLVTPDLIFDYFEPLLKKEIYSGELFELYHLTCVILEKLQAGKSEENLLEQKIVKTISLIYILAHFEKLKPTAQEIVLIYRHSYRQEEIEQALKNLIEKEFVIYLRQSNSYLRLKETSGVDIIKTIHDQIERERSSFILSEVLNKNNDEPYFYPYRYNDQKEMTRFFQFHFIEGCQLSSECKLDKIEAENFSDGKIFAVICKTNEEIQNSILNLQTLSTKFSRYIFVVLKKSFKIEKAARELSAIRELCTEASGDEILLSEYGVLQEDLKEFVSDYIKKYTHPENNFCHYFYNGKKILLKRRCELSSLLSDICSTQYDKTPIINNEAINKNEITSMAYNSRKKILAGLLRTPLEKNLGLSGSGQDVAIMRSTLLYVGLLKNGGDNKSEGARLNLDFRNDQFNLAPMINMILDFLKSCEGSKVSLCELYTKLTSSNFGIGLRRGIIPIYLAATINGIKNNLVLYQGERQIQINADSLSLLNDDPKNYFLFVFSLDEEKKSYLEKLESIFAANGSTPQEIYFSIYNWYLSLPKYSREYKGLNDDFLKAIKAEVGAQELLFSKLPKAFKSNKTDEELASKIGETKEKYEELIFDLKSRLTISVNELFGDVAKWCSSLTPSAFEEIFSDGAQRLLYHLKKATTENDINIEEIGLIATGLRIEDWSDEYESIFLNRLKGWKQSAENFSSKSVEDSSSSIEATKGNSYCILFPSSKGSVVTRRFEKVVTSPRSRLLYNKLTDALVTMGKSISEEEKRQVVVEILEKMCGGDVDGLL